MRCPICGAREPREPEPPRPFCGARCKEIDLHRWLIGAYAVPGEPVELEPREQDP
ncbi:MAG: DNA gyrase inhibitor YacG [Polyangiaceae bacterium]|nr:DNA gyrase inhibitor YacG [Polyangiaceae bacterium]